MSTATVAAASSAAVSAIESAPAPEPAPAPNPAAARARAVYMSGDSAKAAEAFEAAVKVSSADWRVWADGAIAWGEAGRPDKAVAWTRKSVALHDTPESRASLGWALFRAGEWQAADEELARALGAGPGSAWALLGAGRVKLALGRPKEAIDLLAKAAKAAPGQPLADFFLGAAYEKLGDEASAAEAYKRAVGADSYFNEGRTILARTYVRQRRYNEALRQLQKLVEADPGSKLARATLAKIRPLITHEEPAPTSGAPAPSPAASPAAMPFTELWGEKVPGLRIGVSSTLMGKPRARKSATIKGNGGWKALDPKTGRVLLTAEAGEEWTLRIVPAKKGKKKSRSRLEWKAEDGRVAAVPGDAVLLRGVDPPTSALTLVDDPDHASRSFRGELELALYGGRRTIRVVNIVGLEDYTHGVVSAEMPQRAPVEALKAQAVVARTHALFIKTVTKRHRKEGYDVCDEQHCQVYGGIKAETERTRAVVSGTRGRIATFEGKPAHVIYSSHCGGSTQSGTDIGWGNVPYWKSVVDSAEPESPASSPLELRRKLSDWPHGYDRPSGYVYPAHARWTRAVPAKELEEKLNRKFKIGRLRGLRVLRRVPSGHVESLLVSGTKRSKTLSDELDIRSLLGVGSLRSTMFVIDTEYRKEKKALVPETFVFRGGGWGHAVGMCQSGAMGRAEAGDDYEKIVKAYFAGVELGSLPY